MPITTDACVFHAKNMIGDSVTLFDAANTHLGVGDSDAAFSAGQSDLQGSNKVREDMDAGYPQRDPDNDGSDNKTRYQSTYGQAQANFEWKEWGLFNAETGGVMHNREVEYIGEKTDKATWVFQVDISLIASE